MPIEDDRPKWLLDYFRGVYELRYYSVIFEGKKYAVVKKSGHMAWTHNYAPWHYEPTTYEIVTKMAKGCMDDPGRKEIGTGRLTKEKKARYARILKQAHLKR